MDKARSSLQSIHRMGSSMLGKGANSIGTAGPHQEIEVASIQATEEDGAAAGPIGAM